LTGANHEIPGGLANVDTVIAVGGMAQNALVLFEEGIHGRPRERNPTLQLLRVSGQVRVLPCRSRRAFLTRAHREPGGRAEVRMLRGVVRAFQSTLADIGFTEVGHRIAAGFEKKDDIFGVGDPVATEAYTHAPA